MTAKLQAEQRAETKARRAANHSLEAFSLQLAEESARAVKQHLKVVNYYTEGAFSDELQRVNLLVNRLGYDGDNLADSHQRLEDMTTHVTKNTYVLTGEERERLRVALPKARSVAASHGPIHPGRDSIGDGEALLAGSQTLLDYMAGDDITWLIESIERLATSPRFGEKRA
ncbi:hypothetical protein [Bosea vestrisii]|uniref:Uncharacterized protein n=1 Tax=Bosea vestrisii TaxID=151416 RepID=A0ABW0H6L4_9HYPH